MTCWLLRAQQRWPLSSSTVWSALAIRHSLFAFSQAALSATLLQALQCGCCCCFCCCTCCKKVAGKRSILCGSHSRNLPPTTIHYAPFCVSLSHSATRFSSRISHKPTTRASVRRSQIPFLCVLDFIPRWLIFPLSSPSTCASLCRGHMQHVSNAHHHNIISSIFPSISMIFFASQLGNREVQQGI